MMMNKLTKDKNKIIAIVSSFGHQGWENQHQAKFTLYYYINGVIIGTPGLRKSTLGQIHIVLLHVSQW